MSLIVSGIRQNITAIGLIRPNGTRSLKFQILKFQKFEMPPPPHFKDLKLDQEDVCDR